MKTRRPFTSLVSAAGSIALLLPGLIFAADPAATNATDRLTERDYIVEELKVAEEHLAREEEQGKAGRTTPDRIVSAKRSVLSLKRQLAAYDERTKYRTPEKIAEDKKAVDEMRQQAEEKKRQADALKEEQKQEEEKKKQRTEALKAELLGLLLDIARKDTDSGVRQVAINSISRLGLASSIEPLSEIVLKDTEPSVRQLALSAIADFRNADSAAVLLRVYDELPAGEVYLRKVIIGRLAVQEKEPQQVPGAYTIVERLPTNAIPKLIEIAKNSTARELRLAALERLNGITGETITGEMVSVYDQSGDNELKQSIVQLLGNRADKQAMEKLVKIAKADIDPRSRRMAVELLGNMPFESGGPRRPMPGRFMPPQAAFPPRPLSQP